MKTVTTAALALCLSVLSIQAQTNDTIHEECFSFHGQTTIIYQYKPGFSAPYSGQNSLLTRKEKANSLTSTLFAGARLWKGAGFFINPEMAGGAGLSKVLGLGDAPNGETFRVGSTEPKIYLARLFFTQRFALNDTKVYQESDQNQLAGFVPEKYIGFTVGKVCLADYFDQNTYSHDPRSQFMNWGLMSNGAWDYPANTRGYIPAGILEYVTPVNELRVAFSLLPQEANGLPVSWSMGKSNSVMGEYARHFTFSGRPGVIRFLAFINSGKMGNYNAAVALNPTAPVIEDVQQFGNTKYGFGLNAEQQLTDNMGAFFRAGWNDGHTQTWAFTEIDQSLSLGLSANGNMWSRAHDEAGIAEVASGLSNPHKNYLKAGGYGFMLGDGTLNYAIESATEVFYKAELNKNLYLTADYQLILNPGYNQDRSGPVNVFSLRLHTEI